MTDKSFKEQFLEFLCFVVFAILPLIAFGALIGAALEMLVLTKNPEFKVNDKLYTCKVVGQKVWVRNDQ